MALSLKQIKSKTEDKHKGPEMNRPSKKVLNPWESFEVEDDLLEIITNRKEKTKRTERKISQTTTNKKIKGKTKEEKIEAMAKKFFSDLS